MKSWKLSSGVTKKATRVNIPGGEKPLAGWMTKVVLWWPGKKNASFCYDDGLKERNVKTTSSASKTLVRLRGCAGSTPPNGEPTPVRVCLLNNA